MLGTIIYVSLLVVNSMAVLSEDRFLARIGWASSSQVQNANAAFHQTYDPQTGGYGAQQGGEPTMKARLVDLISAVRTLMRSTCHFSTSISSPLTRVLVPLIGLNIIIILYELLLGG
ncbi:Yos1-like-domain-containing protein [Mycena galopus ATCC 62051]|nr:Yos1-like-domain-containing protein [Mycena galopus ATCC 62051]